MKTVFALSEMKASDYFEQWLTEQKTMAEPNTYVLMREI